MLYLNMANSNSGNSDFNNLYDLPFVDITQNHILLNDELLEYI